MQKGFGLGGASVFSVTVKEIMDEFNLECISGSPNTGNIIVKTAEVNRPGLQLAGYLDYFGTDRVQVIGKAEVNYLSHLPPDERKTRIDTLFKYKFPCMVVARGLKVEPEVIEASERYVIPVLRTKDTTSGFLSGLIRYLNFQLAQRTTMHGVFVEVYGEGILILGESGVGKSETALELVKRGHRLIADDVVEIRKVWDNNLMGTAPDVIRHFIEIRGIGILDVKNLYGVGAVKVVEKISLVLKLEMCENIEDYDRLGIDDHYTEILDVKIPLLTVPVRPGRNLAITVEVAAMNGRQKRMGYNAAQALNERITAEKNAQLKNK